MQRHKEAATLTHPVRRIEDCRQAQRVEQCANHVGVLDEHLEQLDCPVVSVLHAADPDRSQCPQSVDQRLGSTAGTQRCDELLSLLDAREQSLNLLSEDNLLEQSVLDPAVAVRSVRRHRLAGLARSDTQAGYVESRESH